MNPMNVVKGTCELRTASYFHDLPTLICYLATFVAMFSQGFVSSTTTRSNCTKAGTKTCGRAAIVLWKPPISIRRTSIFVTYLTEEAYSDVPTHATVFGGKEEEHIRRAVLKWAILEYSGFLRLDLRSSKRRSSKPTTPVRLPVKIMVEASGFRISTGHCWEHN